jgi:hypothetical protein
MRAPISNAAIVVSTLKRADPPCGSARRAVASPLIVRLDSDVADGVPRLAGHLSGFRPLAPHAPECLGAFVVCCCLYPQLRLSSHA